MILLSLVDSPAWSFVTVRELIYCRVEHFVSALTAGQEILVMMCSKIDFTSHQMELRLGRASLHMHLAKTFRAVDHTIVYQTFQRLHKRPAISFQSTWLAIN